MAARGSRDGPFDVRASFEIDGFTKAMAGLDKLAKLSTSERDRAFSAGLRKVGRGIRSDAIKEVKARYGLAARARSAGIRSPRISSDSVEIWATRRPRTAFQWGFKPVSYKTKTTRRGMKAVTWQIMKGQEASSPRAFVNSQRRRANHLPFIRNRGRDRLPIRVIVGPSMHGILRGPTLRAPLTAAAERRIDGDFVPEFHRVLERWL